MATITTEGFVKGTNNAANTLTGDAVVARALQIFKSEGFGLYSMFAKEYLKNGSTFIYKTPERLIPEAFVRTGNGALGKGGVIPQVEITADIRDVIYYEIEDSEMSTQILSPEEIDIEANSMLQSMTAQFDAEILTELLTASGLKSTITNFNISKPTTEKIKESRILLNDVVADNESLIDAKTLGVPSTNQLIILSPKAYGRYTASFDTFTDENTKRIMVGALQGLQIGGTIIIKHPIIGRKLEKGIIHATKSYDLSLDKVGGNPLEGFVITDISAAFPITMLKGVSRINKFGNTEIIQKYKFGKGVLRPNLIQAIVSEKISNESSNETESLSLNEVLKTLLEEQIKLSNEIKQIKTNEVKEVKTNEVK